MATRGRPNTTAKKAPAKVVAAKPSIIAKAKGVIAKIPGIIPTSTTSKKSGNKGNGIHKKTAKQKLKRAYERKAKRQISMGMLGQARRTLRKKATVV